MQHKGKNTSVALIRRYLPGFLNYWDHLCALGGPPLGFGEQLPTMDPCDWFAFYLHPICANSTQKEQLFKLQGVWHMDEQSECRGWLCWAERARPVKPFSEAPASCAACRVRGRRDKLWAAAPSAVPHTGSSYTGPVSLS